MSIDKQQAGDAMETLAQCIATWRDDKGDAAHLTALALADIAESLRAIQLSLAQAFGRGGPVYLLLEAVSKQKECGAPGLVDARCSLPGGHPGKHVDGERNIWWTEKFDNDERGKR